ncbi:hypothetical protein [Actinomycetospora cinnamomea]|nr:hypothetical protein [Actinomycetospora cinnamomea]
MLLALAAALAGLLMRAEPAPFHLLAAAALVLTVVLGVLVSAFGGLVVGLVTAAVVIVVKQAVGAWTPADFVASLQTTLGLLVVGALAGLAGSVLRSDRGHRSSGAAAAYGSLGLLTEQAVTARLDEEIARARRHRRPLAVILIRTEITDPDLGDGTRMRAHRTVARLVESLLREIDIPFALSPEEVGAVLPETDVEGAWLLLGPLVDAATRASFTVREEDGRRTLADCAEVHAGLAALSDETPRAEDLLVAARASIREDDPGQGPPGARHRSETGRGAQ